MFVPGFFFFFFLLAILFYRSFLYKSYWKFLVENNKKTICLIAYPIFNLLNDFEDNHTEGMVYLITLLATLLILKLFLFNMFFNKNFNFIEFFIFLKTSNPV